MTRYVAIYCRISQDKRGRAEGVKSQERWGRDYAASAWPDLPIEVFADNDLSAADPKVTRPEFERLRQWITDGLIAHIWAVEQYRFVRQEVEWFKVAAELDAAGITELHTNRDGIVRVQDEVAGIKAVLGAGEVRRLKQRINDRLAEVAASGAPAGGVRFGYRRAARDDGTKTFVIEPDEAEIIRECADKVLAGWGLSTLVNDLNARGIRGPRGGKIGPTQIGGWLTSPTVAGHRVYQGRIVGRGNWPPILDEDTWQAVRAKLSQPRRVKRADGNGTHEITAKFFGQSTGRKYLLTGGIGACGVCGAPLIGRPVRIRRAEPLAYLVCPGKKQGGHSCVGIAMDKAERHVLDRLFAELDKPEFLDAIGADDHARQRDEITAKLGALDGRRNELAETWAAGDLTAAEWTTARRALAEREQQLRAELAAIPPPMTNVDITGAREAWPDMTLNEQREFLGLFIERVVVNRATTRSRWGPVGERVDIEWRTL